MPTPKTVKQLWTEYAEAVYPTVDKESVQYIELERTFYSGCFSIFTEMTSMVDESEDGEPTDADLKKMDNMFEEMTMWFAAQMGGRLDA